MSSRFRLLVREAAISAAGRGEVTSSLIVGASCSTDGWGADSGVRSLCAEGESASCVGCGARGRLAFGFEAEISIGFPRGGGSFLGTDAGCRTGLSGSTAGLGSSSHPKRSSMPGLGVEGVEACFHLVILAEAAVAKPVAAGV